MKTSSCSPVTLFVFLYQVLASYPVPNASPVTQTHGNEKTGQGRHVHPLAHLGPRQHSVGALRVSCCEVRMLQHCRFFLLVPTQDHLRFKVNLGS